MTETEKQQMVAASGCKSIISKLGRKYTWAGRTDRFTMVHAFPGGDNRSLCGLAWRMERGKWSTANNGWTGWCSRCLRAGEKIEAAP